MTTSAPDKLLTIAEFHALPEDDSVDRELIRGVLWEEPMTKRSKWHAKVELLIGSLLNEWLRTRPEPRGEVYSGEIGCDLPSVGTSVGIDVAYFSAETVAVQDDEAPYVVGAPVLAVEILSPSDTIERIRDKIRTYEEAGTALVWVVDPRFENVTIYELGQPQRMTSGDDELSAEPHLPGFAVPVRRLFER